MRACVNCGAWGDPRSSRSHSSHCNNSSNSSYRTPERIRLKCESKQTELCDDNFPLHPPAFFSPDSGYLLQAEPRNVLPEMKNGQVGQIFFLHNVLLKVGIN